MSRKLPIALILVLLAATAAMAIPLSAQAKSPTIDGTISRGEYGELTTLNGIEFGAALSPEGILSLAIRAPASGWVAIGLGTGIMDGSWILMAYESDGKQSFSEQKGISHFHEPIKDTRVIAKAVHTADGYTTLEFRIRLADFEKNGRLPVILAYARRADFRSYHEAHAQTVLTF
ncbi:MAG TPA: hypothetical protein VMV83_14300 [Rectinemataceae bacterium]|nr:hypothetical protein [Rectinemataceae bacterium]